MKSKWYVFGTLALTTFLLSIIAFLVIFVDPYFHFHKPVIEKYYYSLYNQRSQNDGILRHFDYNGLIVGTSMTENFKTSDAERVFGIKFIKTPYSGATYKEISTAIETALQHNSDVSIVIRSLDMTSFFRNKDEMRTDLGDYPEYLYNENPFDDVYYIFNREVFFSTIYNMIIREDNMNSGITSFDEYSNWMVWGYPFGKNALLPNGLLETNRSVLQNYLTEEEKQTIIESIRQNVKELAENNPNVEFYCYFPPYSAMWWQSLINSGDFVKQIQAERIVIEELIKTDNIKLYSFNTFKEITTDLNNYKDMYHYAGWINELLLSFFKEGKGRITEKNYENYIESESELYWTMDYEDVFNKQEDYENDEYASLIMKEKYGMVTTCHYLSKENILEGELKNAVIKDNQYNGSFGVVCKGRLHRKVGSIETVGDYIKETGDFDGVKIIINNIDEYCFISTYGRKISEHGQPSIIVYDENGVVVAQTYSSYGDIDADWHRFIVDVSQLRGKVEIVFHGGYNDESGSADSEYVFSDIKLY